MHRYPYLPKVVRSKRGSILGVTLAVFGFFIFALVIFHFKAVRLMGGHQEQTTAAEAAALVAANDISKIVVADSNFGWISLSNQPATGTATIAGDGYPLPVRSINDILATIRLDMLIADLVPSAELKAQAINDYNNALAAQANLVTALHSAASGSGQAFDANGNAIDLVADATTAYNANLVRMTGKSSQLVPGSLTVAIGACQAGVCNSPIPHDSKGNLYTAGAANSKGWYNAYVNCTYGKTPYNFIFAAVADTPAIIDTSNYVDAVSGLPYQTPSVVKVDADQSYTDQSSFGTPSHYSMHCTACAEAGSNPNAWPISGTLVFGFPDGTLAEVPQPFNLAQAVAGSGVNESYYTASPLDVPGNASQLTAVGMATVPADTAIYDAIYDWLKASGPRLVTDIFAKANSPVVPTGTPCLIAYSSSSQGLKATVYNCEHIYPMASNQQPTGMSNPSLAAASTGQTYDLLIVDNVHNFNISGGGFGFVFLPSTHVGTPAYDIRLASNSQFPPGIVQSPLVGPYLPNPFLGWSSIHGGWGYQVFHTGLQAAISTMPGGGDTSPDYYGGGGAPPPPGPPASIRPTFPGGGLAVDISLHKVINALPTTTVTF